MADQGVVSHLVDSGDRETVNATTGGINCIPGREWIDDLNALKPDGPRLLIRAPLAAGPNNDVQPARIAAALDVYHAAGYRVIPVLGQGFHRPPISSPAEAIRLAPNAPLSLVGPQYGPTGVNAYIQGFSLKAEGVCAQLVKHGLDSVWIYNEPNLMASIPPGANCPPVADGRSPSMSPEAFMVLCLQTASRCRAVGIKTIYLGALSCLVKFSTDPAGDWEAGYLERGYQFLAKHGITTYPWNYLAINMEGLVTKQYAAHTAQVWRALLARHHDPSKLAIGEWSWRRSSYNHVDAAATFHALNDNFDQMFFFSHPVRNQRDPGDYGAVAWSTKDGRFMPGARTPWWNFLQAAYAGKL